MSQVCLEQLTVLAQQCNQAVFRPLLLLYSGEGRETSRFQAVFVWDLGWGN